MKVPPNRSIFLSPPVCRHLFHFHLSLVCAVFISDHIDYITLVFFSFTSISSSQLFSDVAYKARDREDLIAGIDEFLDEVIVLPPGEWDPKIRIEPPKKVPSADKRFEF